MTSGARHESAHARRPELGTRPTVGGDPPEVEQAVANHFETAYRERPRRRPGHGLIRRPSRSFVRRSVSSTGAGFHERSALIRLSRAARLRVLARRRKDQLGTTPDRELWKAVTHRGTRQPSSGDAVRLDRPQRNRPPRLRALCPPPTRPGPLRTPPLDARLQPKVRGRRA